MLTFINVLKCTLNFTYIALKLHNDFSSVPLPSPKYTIKLSQMKCKILQFFQKKILLTLDVIYYYSVFNGWQVFLNVANELMIFYSRKAYIL